MLEVIGKETRMGMVVVTGAEVGVELVGYHD